MFKSKETKLFKLLAVLILPLFISSFIYLPGEVEAAESVVVSIDKLSVDNPISRAFVLNDIPKNSFRWLKRDKDAVLNVTFDSFDSSRLYILQETSQNQTLTFRYLYNDAQEIVTLLFSRTTKNNDPHYTYYYQFQALPTNGLGEILEEGWIHKGSLMPSKIYDYYRGEIEIRNFDREGKLLKVISSNGFERQFHYTREGRLLTIQDMAPSGDSRFHDLLMATSKSLANENSSRNPNWGDYALPTRTDDKALISKMVTTQTVDPDLDLSLHQIRSQEFEGYLLNWLTGANHLRAGPLGGGKLL